MKFFDIDLYNQNGLLSLLLKILQPLLPTKANIHKIYNDAGEEVVQ